MAAVDIQPVVEFMQQLQDQICSQLEAVDAKATFQQESWDKPSGGGGRSRMMTEGAVFEKGGVNFSHVQGENMPGSATAHRPELAGRSYQAVGVSLVMHPENPYVPTSHANIRFFIAEKEGEEPIWWFGGGFDLTPCYGYEQDCRDWHRTSKAICDRFGPELYPKYKDWCDRYFYLKHRDEPRGIGGLFFDDLNQPDFDCCFDFVKAIGEGYLNAYLPLVERRKDTPYGEAEKRFQRYRRGRYVEFNLVFDRGTLFGLQSGGRTESILMSLPPEVRWEYGYQAKPGSAEARLTEYFLQPHDWLAEA
tara:strand:+ start:12864 stop:13781 length:918 start_codon:yes stop_codon:yes gene_type:complete